MAAFTVLSDFRIPDDYQGRFIQPGAFYIGGDVVNGLTAAEARELYELAGDALEPIDEEAYSIHDYVVSRLEIGGAITVKSETEVS